jgi:gamma-glutamylcyclotransferase (GGCT)/AIG2-like uncharacterized protein YtfP
MIILLTTMTMKCCVFAYGTLGDVKIRKEVLGYDTPSYPAAIEGFRTDSIKLGNTYYPILVENERSNVPIGGEYFMLGDTDLSKLDHYESEAYRRKLVRINNGMKAWVYLR